MLEVLRADVREEGQEVAAWCTAIAERLALPRSRVDGLTLGAALHDIGNVTIPMRVLVKAGPLSRAESALMREHCQRGHDLLRDLDFPWPVDRMVLEHHERFDGSGYPNRLRGGETCLEARIIAVADALVAMCRERPYRPARTLDRALEELQAHRGRRYDPDVVEALAQVAGSGAVHSLLTASLGQQIERLWQRVRRRSGLDP